MELILLIYTYNYIIYRYNDKIYLFDCKLEIGIDSKLLRLNPSKSELADKNFNFIEINSKRYKGLNAFENPPISSHFSSRYKYIPL